PPLNATPAIPLPSSPTRRSSDLQIMRRTIALVLAQHAAQFRFGRVVVLALEVLARLGDDLPVPRIPFQAGEAALGAVVIGIKSRSEEHTSELQSHLNLVCRLPLE